MLRLASQRREHQIFPLLEVVPDLSRGEQRLAAEVLFAVLDGEPIPDELKRRALGTLEILAWY